jgi:gliding motility-associated-like protein
MRKPRIFIKIQMLLYAVALLYINFSFGQVCPPNIDFENGTFEGWTCYTGFTSAASGANEIFLQNSGGPIAGRHEIMSASPGNGLDEYGGFPKNCPNGSGHSIKLGNNLGGGEAEGVSYEFTIPAGVNAYTMIYNYAVVFQDPNHLEYQQPRLVLEVTNLTDNTKIDCATFTFYPLGSPLPGFELSPNPGTNTPVHFKNWTPVSINLDNLAGKTIRLFFKTTDCTFRRHFGYAYIDVNSECSGSFVGATFCPNDALVNIQAPFGYRNYTWFNSNFSQVLGTGQILTLSPPPPSGTKIAVYVEPYSGYGCPDTLQAQLIDTLTVKAQAGRDTLSCNNEPVRIGLPPKPGIVYQWTPTAGLSSASVSNPFASPNANTTYILKVSSPGGGCVDYDTVFVKASNISNSFTLIGKPEFCLGSTDSAVLTTSVADSIQWFRNGIAIFGQTKNTYKVQQTGTYYAMLFGGDGCNLKTPDTLIDISSVPKAVATVDTPNQCLLTNNFIFTNSSTNAVGTMRFTWNLGDSTIATSADVIHKYKTSGRYNVTMKVNSNAACADSLNFTINVYDNAIASFKLTPTCVNMPVLITNTSTEPDTSPTNYLWTLGNGQTSTIKNPPPINFTNGGTYTYTLSVNTPQCPTPLSTLSRKVVVEAPRPAIRYADAGAVVNLPAPLAARNFGVSYLWQPARNLSVPDSMHTVFKGITDQLYTIKITTANACVTIDTQFVKVYPAIAIYVPTGFTPNADDLNDFLSPTTIGIKQVKSFRIFNRYGQQIFNTTNFRPGWDGSFKGVPQPSQSYAWVFEGIGADDKNYVQKGSFMLIR